MPKKKVLVSIVVLNFNGRQLTDNLLCSIKKIDFPKGSVETIVVDNASSDGSMDFLRKRHKNVIFVENKKNLGFSGGMNSGVKYANGRYVAVLSNDLIVHKDWLRELIRVIKKDAKIAIADPLIFQRTAEKGNKKQYDPEEIGVTTLFNFWSKHEGVDSSTRKEPFYSFSPSGSCLFNKEILGMPFDTDYFAYAEDTYIGWLARIKGYEVVRVPTSIVYHEGSITINNMNMNDHFLFLGERNRFLNMFLFYEAKTLLKLIPFFIIMILFLNICQPKKIVMRLKIYSWLIMNAGLVMKKRKKIQGQRKVPDKEIMKLMSCKLLESTSFKSPIIRGSILLMNRISYAYCFIFGIRTIEFNKEKNNFYGL